MGTCKSISVKEPLSLNNTKKNDGGKKKHVYTVEGKDIRDGAKNELVGQYFEKLGKPHENKYQLRPPTSLLQKDHNEGVDSVSRLVIRRPENQKEKYQGNFKKISELVKEGQQECTRSFALKCKDIVYKVPELQMVEASSIHLRRNKEFRFWNSEKIIVPSVGTLHQKKIANEIRNSAPGLTMKSQFHALKLNEKRNKHQNIDIQCGKELNEWIQESPHINKLSRAALEYSPS